MKIVLKAAALVLGVAVAAGAQDVASVVHGTVKKVDAATKTAVISTGKGAEEVVQFTDKTVVHGTVAGSKDAFQGLKEGSEVVIRTTGTGAKKTAVEVDNLSKDGLKSAEVTITKVDAGTKKVVVKTADGAEQTYDMTAHAAAEAGKATAAGTEKAGKTTVYYTEEGGKKVVHFFKKM